MPEVCRFYGIIIRFYYREHPPRHFHAIYGDHEALIEIETGDIMKDGCREPLTIWSTCGA
jgi:Domain of unknown function (DUF4160)